MVGLRKGPISASWLKFPTIRNHSGSDSGRIRRALLAAVNGALAAMRRDGSMNQTQGEVGRAVSDGPTREFITYSLQI